MMESTAYRHTSTGSKKAIFTFLVSFFACLFLLDNTADLFTGMIFVFSGVCIASVAIAMPFYFYKKKHRQADSIISMVEFLLTICLTIMFFLYCFVDSHKLTTISSPENTDSPYLVRCDEPVPAFSFDTDIMPNKMQADTVCSCIWQKLSPSEKNLSASLTRNKQYEVSEEQLRLFTYKFNLITKECSKKQSSAG